jgi:hypothetical protein
MPILSLTIWYWRQRVVRMFEPEVTKRVKLIHSANPEDKQLENDNRPNDLMQWLIDQASHSTDPIH